VPRREGLIVLLAPRLVKQEQLSLSTDISAGHPLGVVV